MDSPAAAAQNKSAVVAKEIRFSVVMYGGVSLAIYMNGVTQELLHMVRSTARTSWDNAQGTQFRFLDPTDPNANASNSLKSTESIYRKLAFELNDPEVDDVRFIIDVISGTSAGGINGIFLAKALTDDSLSRVPHPCRPPLAREWVLTNLRPRLLQPTPQLSLLRSRLAGRKMIAQRLFGFAQGSLSALGSRC